jgi:predicted HTH domain antitoxin
MSKRVVLEFPTEMPNNSSKDKEALRKGKEAMVLELLRKGQISQGKASQLLEMDRWTLFDIMAKNNIPMANFSVEELERQREDFEKREK